MGENVLNLEFELAPNQSTKRRDAKLTGLVGTGVALQCSKFHRIRLRFGKEMVASVLVVKNGENMQIS